MVAFIDAHREASGVEPICAQLPIDLSGSGPSKSWQHAFAALQQSSS